MNYVLWSLWYSTCPLQDNQVQLPNRWGTAWKIQSYRRIFWKSVQTPIALNRYSGWLPPDRESMQELQNDVDAIPTLVTSFDVFLLKGAWVGNALLMSNVTYATQLFESKEGFKEVEEYRASPTNLCIGSCDPPKLGLFKRAGSIYKDTSRSRYQTVDPPKIDIYFSRSLILQASHLLKRRYYCIMLNQKGRKKGVKYMPSWSVISRPKCK